MLRFQKWMRLRPRQEPEGESNWAREWLVPGGPGRQLVERRRVVLPRGRPLLGRPRRPQRLPGLPPCEDRMSPCHKSKSFSLFPRGSAGDRGWSSGVGVCAGAAARRDSASTHPDGAAVVRMLEWMRNGDGFVFSNSHFGIQPPDGEIPNHANRLQTGFGAPPSRRLLTDERAREWFWHIGFSIELSRQDADAPGASAGTKVYANIGPRMACSASGTLRAPALAGSRRPPQAK